jgi:hypothetical protein
LAYSAAGLDERLSHLAMEATEFVNCSNRMVDALAAEDAPAWKG